MGNKHLGFTLAAPIWPQDAEGIKRRLDPRFCPSCLLRLHSPGATFCPSCRAQRYTIAQRLWQRANKGRERERRAQQRSVG